MINELMQKELAEIEQMVEEAKQHEQYTEKVFYLREGMIKLAGGFAQAALLSSLLGWTRHWLKTDNEIYKQIQKAAENNDLVKVRKLKEQIRQGWFWKAYREMSEELLNEVSPKTCERYVEKFEEMGLISSREPDKKAIYRAKWYKADIDKIKEELNKLGFELDHYKELKNSTRQNDESQDNGFYDQKRSKTAPLCIRQNDEPSRQNDEPSRQNDEHLLLSTITTTSFTTNTSKYVGNSRLPVVDKYAENYKLTSYAEQNLMEMIKLHGESLVGAAFDRAIKAETGKPIAYIEGVIRKWCVAGVSTVEEIEAYEKRFRDSKQKKTKKKADPNKMMEQLPRSVAKQMEQQTPEQEQKQANDLEEKRRRIQAKLALNEENKKRKTATESEF